MSNNSDDIPDKAANTDSDEAPDKAANSDDGADKATNVDDGTTNAANVMNGQGQAIETVPAPAPQQFQAPPVQVAPVVHPEVVKVEVETRQPKPIQEEAFAAAVDDPEEMKQPLMNKQQPTSTEDEYLYPAPPIMKMQTQLLADQVAGAPTLPLPADSTPFYKRKVFIFIMIGVVLLLLVGGVIGLILAFSGGQTCVRDGKNLCKCDGVYYPLFIDGDSVVFGNLTFTGSQITRLQTVNGNNTVSTYSIFEQVDSATLKCETTLGESTAVYNSTEQYPWDGQLKDGKPFGYGIVSEDTEQSTNGSIATVMLNGKATGLATGVAPLQEGLDGFFIFEMRDWQLNGLGTLYAVQNPSLVVNTKAHNDNPYDTELVTPADAYWPNASSN